LQPLALKEEQMKLSKLITPCPFAARHYKRTFVGSADDQVSHPSRSVIELAIQLIKETQDVDISDICKRLHPKRAKVVQTWPGEHYRLLAGAVAVLKPMMIVEVGTETGLSALCLMKNLPPGGKVITFDLIPWNEIDNGILKDEDFASGSLKQEIGDLSKPAVFKKYADTIAQADVLFLDGPKDGKFEPRIAELLNTLPFKTPPWVLYDDIKDLHMLRFWRELKKPKLDFTSFGSWTGTGLVSWVDEFNNANSVKNANNAIDSDEE